MVSMVKISARQCKHEYTRNWLNTPDNKFRAKKQRCCFCFPLTFLSLYKVTSSKAGFSSSGSKTSAPSLCQSFRHSPQSMEQDQCHSKVSHLTMDIFQLAGMSHCLEMFGPLYLLAQMASWKPGKYSLTCYCYSIRLCHCLILQFARYKPIYKLFTCYTLLYCVPQTPGR